MTRTASLDVGAYFDGLGHLGVVKQLRAEPGVQEASSNPGSASVTVRYDEGVTNLGKLRTVIEACGQHCRGEAMPTHICAPGAMLGKPAPTPAKADSLAGYAMAAPHAGHDMASPHAGQDMAEMAGMVKTGTARDDMAAEMGHGAGGDMQSMVRDMRNRFWVALVFTIPIFIYSPMAGLFKAPPPPFGLRLDVWLLILGSAAVLYPSWPFFVAAVRALRNGVLNMAVLVVLSVGTGFVFSVASVLFFPGVQFFEAVAVLLTCTEATARKRATELLSRGTVYANLTVKRTGAASVVRINDDVLASILKVASEISARTDAVAPSVDGLLGIKGVIEVVEPESDEAEMQAARASVQVAQTNLRYARIEAPIAGRISLSNVTPGALVTANQSTALTEVVQIDPMYVDFTQSTAQLLQLQRDWAAGRYEKLDASSMPIALQLEDGSAYPHVGKLQFSGLMVNPSMGTVTLRAVVPNPDGQLLPGMFAQAVLPTGMASGALLIPQQAVTRDATGRASVLVVQDREGQKIAVQRTVQLAQAVGNQWLVESGVQAGDMVVVEGFQRFKPGDRVDPQTMPAQRPAAAAVDPQAAAAALRSALERQP